MSAETICEQEPFDDDHEGVRQVAYRACVEPRSVTATL
jgi:hypothetical protein